MHLWHHFARAQLDAPIPQILGALLAAGIETEELDRSRLKGPGVLFFDQFRSSLCELVQELTLGGRERVIVIALAASALRPEVAWPLLGAGASDVFAWRDDSESAQIVAARLERWAEIDEIVASPVVQRTLAGNSPSWLSVVRQVVEAACFSQSPVLVTGESGTGKELVARMFHKLDRRQNKRELVVLDCSTLVASLSGSEFFGHERGAFTGAVSARDGAFALADGGTLFLDEIGELPLELQAQLLRAVQEQSYRRVGGNVWKHAEFRLVCATNRDLQAEVASGRFRADLYYRIAGVSCQLPPLRDRMSDVPLLAERFVNELSPDGQVRSLDPLVLSWLLQREYRNNVRELRVVVARMLQRHAGSGPLSVGDIPLNERPALASGVRDWRDAGFVGAISRAMAAGAGLKEIGRAAEDVAEQIAIEQEGSIATAAARLGVTDRALQMRRAARRERGAHGNGFAETG